MMKVLDYEKVNGTQDRDDTILIAHIMPRYSSSDSSTETAAVVVDGEHGDGLFDSKNLVVEKPKTGPLSPTAEAPTSNGAGLV